MKNCPICGKPVRMGAYHITVNRRRGVAHYIAHLDGSPMHEPGWECSMMKPYPVNKADTPYQKLIDRWEAA
jgi:hypothetical protein